MMVHCYLCHQDFPEPELGFAEHLDKHSDAEWKRWPGGLDALEQLLLRCQQAGRA